jgi:hypothetical protein
MDNSFASLHHHYSHYHYQQNHHPCTPVHSTHKPTQTQRRQNTLKTSRTPRHSGCTAHHAKPTTFTECHTCCGDYNLHPNWIPFYSNSMESNGAYIPTIISLSFSNSLYDFFITLFTVIHKSYKRNPQVFFGKQGRTPLSLKLHLSPMKAFFVNIWKLDCPNLL